MGDPIKEEKDNHGEYLQVHGCTDKGQLRPHNEDYYGFYLPADSNIKDRLGSLFAISDGVGSHLAGEAASAEAVNTVLQEYYFGSYTDKLPGRLRDAFNHTAVHIFDLAKANRAFSNMQCTLSALLIRQGKFHIAHVGDSKVFLLRSGRFVQLTKDHSLVGRLVRLGFVTPEAARSHPNKHVLLRSLGEQPIMPADMYAGNALPGDLFYLITDGILEHMTEEELKLFLLEHGHETDALNKLIEQLNERGGYDNMTILTIKIGEK
ncbi:MAG: protein phosphatase 2C domain-containing protein [Thermacetogeniaceae bacterium]